MDFRELSNASTLAKQYQETRFHYDLIESKTTDAFGITIKGTYQDKAFLEALRPHALKELQRRMDLLAWELDKLGVKV